MIIFAIATILRVSIYGQDNVSGINRKRDFKLYLLKQYLWAWLFILGDLNLAADRHLLNGFEKSIIDSIHLKNIY